jgi:N-acetylmuramoyl-L-alanine amidase
VSVGLRERPRLANEAKGDVFVSIHCNAHELPEAHGMEVFFLAADASAKTTRELIEREEGIAPGEATAGLPWSVTSIVRDLDMTAAHWASEALAMALADALVKSRPGARFRGVKQAPFGVLKEARMPAVVLEVGYISHPQEVHQLLDPATPQAFGRALLLALRDLDTKLTNERKGTGKPKI